MKQMLKKGTKTAKTEKTPYQKPLPPFYTEKWEKAGLNRIENDFGTVFLRETHYAFNHQHGKYRLGQFYEALEAWEVYEQEHPLKMTSDEKIIFYDTETTGLKGVGTHIFLNGLLEETSDGFVLKQYILADPANEAAFLFESKFWQANQTIVTYNGKSFDWPQLQTRWTLNREHLPPLREHQQIDLFHSSKRIWKNDLSRMKLTTVEQQKLGFQRIDDLPGHLAPMVYLDAVRSGDHDMLFQVLRHNEYDLLSLITLFIQATELVFSEANQEHAIVHTNIGKWYHDLKQLDSSQSLLENITENYATNEAAEAYYLLALQQKKQKKYAEAAESYEKALPYLEERQWIEASLGLAKLYEHQLHDLEEAEKHTLNALFRVRQSLLFKKDVQQRKREAIEKRFLRIRKKQGMK